VETTLFSVLTSLMHHGMITVGLPYAYPGLVKMDEVTGRCTLWGLDDRRARWLSATDGK